MKRVITLLIMVLTTVGTFAQTSTSQRWDETKEDWYRRVINFDYDVPDYDVSRPDSNVVGWRTAKILKSLERNYGQGSYIQRLSHIRNEQMGVFKHLDLPIETLKVKHIQKRDSVISITVNTISKREKKKVKFDIIFTFVNSLSENEEINQLFSDIGRYIRRDD